MNNSKAVRYIENVAERIGKKILVCQIYAFISAGKMYSDKTLNEICINFQCHMGLEEDELGIDEIKTLYYRELEKITGPPPRRIIFKHISR